MEREETTPPNFQELFQELQDRQLADVPPEWKLSNSDLQYILSNVMSSIFGDECCIWSGSNASDGEKPKKRPYNNFYHNKKKTALHRLIYSNYVQPLTSLEFIRFNCENKGRCCTVAHLQKYQYSVKNSKKAAKKMDPLKPESSFQIRRNVVVDF